MSETKWTPGRWEFCCDSYGKTRRSRKACIIAMDEKHNSTYVAQRVGSWDDARLIAAAPDLYAALDDLVDAIERLGPLNMPRVLAAKTALRKARGEE